jgi:uncharacterized membrane protein
LKGENTNAKSFGLAVGYRHHWRYCHNRILLRGLVADGSLIMDYVPAISRLIHLLAGVMWIGLLYYFNFVQVAALKSAQGDGSAAGITKHVAPRALFFFRWSALLTWLAGASLLGENFGAAFMLQPSHVAIGIGAWMGTIMLFNVWVLIWPNQKKILGIVKASDDEKNKARRVAMLASRSNTMLSIPMLFFMAAGAHGALYFGA